MDIAKSIFLGGQKIRADDPRLNSSSYRELLLRCTYCKEPVYYKKGEVNQPHFAHFHSLEPKKYEECLLRQQNINSNFSPKHAWWHEQHGRGQRFQLFQEYFIFIIRSAIPDLDIDFLELESQDTKLDELQGEVANFFKNNKEGFFRYIRVFSNQATRLEKDIICEALDYLTISSSKNIFKAVCDYFTEKTEILEPVKTGKIYSREICCRILNLLTKILWLKIFQKITKSEPDKKLLIRPQASKFIRLVEDGNKLYIYLYGASLYLGEVKYCHIENEKLLVKLDYNKLKNSLWAVKIGKRNIVSKHPSKLLHIFEKNDLYGTYEKNIKSFVYFKVYPAIKKVIEDSLEDIKYLKESKCKFFKGESIFLKNAISEFREIGKAKVFLKRKSERVWLADVVINKSAIRYEDIWVFNDFLTFSKEYHSSIKGNPAIEDSVVGVIQEIHALVVNKGDHKSVRSARSYGN